MKKYLKIIPLYLMGLVSAGFIVYAFTILNTEKTLYIPLIVFLVAGGMSVFATSMGYRPEVKEHNSLLAVASYEPPKYSILISWVVTILLVAVLAIATFIVATS